MREPDTTRAMRLRRIADRRGLRLVKSGRRDPGALEYMLYALVDQQTGKAINPPLADRFECSWTLDQVEDYLIEAELRRDNQGERQRQSG